MLRPRGELGQLYEPRRGAGSPCVFTELCGAVGLLMRGSSAETISFPPQRFFSKTELHVLPPTPAHAAPGRERPGALQSARRQTSSAEEEARPQREAGVCVKVPGFCVVRTHSQVLSSNDMM